MKLHLGCGKRYIPGFKHLDVIDASHIDFVGDVGNLERFTDNSIELIYACHVLEHFKRYEVLDVLKEWYRVLKKGGILRLAVPDFEAISNVYQRTRNLEAIYGLLMGGQDHQYNFHHSVYDFKNIDKLLKSIGFLKIKRYDWRNTIHKDYDDYSQAYLPHMDKEQGTLMSLNVEAFK